MQTDLGYFNRRRLKASHKYFSKHERALEEGNRGKGVGGEGCASPVSYIKYRSQTKHD